MESVIKKYLNTIVLIAVLLICSLNQPLRGEEVNSEIVNLESEKSWSALDYLIKSTLHYQNVPADHEEHLKKMNDLLKLVEKQTILNCVGNYKVFELSAKAKNIQELKKLSLGGNSKLSILEKSMCLQKVLHLKRRWVEANYHLHALELKEIQLRQLKDLELSKNEVMNLIDLELKRWQQLKE